MAEEVVATASVSTEPPTAGSTAKLDVSGTAKVDSRPRGGRATGDDAVIDSDDAESSYGGPSSSSSSADDDGDESSNDDSEEGQGRNEPPPDDGLSRYERLRVERIARNNARLAELGFAAPEGGGREKRRRTPACPRRSVPAGSRRRLPGRAGRATFDARTRERREGGPRGMPRAGGRGGPALFEGEHIDDCFMCRLGGELLCCDFCSKAYHLDCHLPPLADIPAGLWKCQECAAMGYVRKFKCGECEACTRNDCGECARCLDKKKFGGPGKMKQVCSRKICPFKRFAPPNKATPLTEKKKTERDLSLQPAKGKAAARSTLKKRKKEVKYTLRKATRLRTNG